MIALGFTLEVSFLIVLAGVGLLGRGHLRVASSMGVVNGGNHPMIAIGVAARGKFIDGACCS